MTSKEKHGDESDEEWPSEETLCSHPRLGIARLSRRLTRSPFLKGPNMFFIMFFAFAFILVELNIARERQFRTVFLVMSPPAIVLATFQVLLNLLCLLDRPTLLDVLRRYIFEFWNLIDLVVVVALWIRMIDAFDLPRSNARDGDGFDNINNDGNAAEWYYLIGLRCFHLIGMLRGLAPELYEQASNAFNAAAGRLVDPDGRQIETVVTTNTTVEPTTFTVAVNSFDP